MFVMERQRRTSEKEDNKLCKQWLVIEKCSGCLFETLCHYQEMKKRIDDENISE
jgi:hypothetical protein